MNTDEALKLLHLTVPTTPNAIKSSYRRLSRLEHPDHSKHPEAEARFAKIRVAYEVLKDDTSVLDPELALEILETVDGIKLATLGEGLGPNTNGAICGECAGNGFRGYDIGGQQLCDDCDPYPGAAFNAFFEPLSKHRKRLVKCWKCDGTGIFTIVSRDGHVTPKGMCFKCQGTGRCEGWCRTCGNKGVVVNKRNKKRYVVCEKCKGLGELPMWNPVLPKGLLIGKGTP